MILNIIQADGVIKHFDSISEWKWNGRWEHHSGLMSGPEYKLLNLYHPFSSSDEKHSGSLLLIINCLSLEQSEVSNAACWIKQMVWSASSTIQAQKNPMRCPEKAREQSVTWVQMPSETHRNVFRSQAWGGL